MNRLSLQSESIEREELQDIHNAATAQMKNKIGLHMETVGNAFVSIATKENSILLNRVIGLGIENPASKETVREIVDIYAREKVNRYFVHLHPQSSPAELKNWLLDAGLIKGRGWQKFVRNTENPHDVKSGLKFKKIGKEYAEDHARIVCRSFDLSDDFMPIVASLVGRPNWHVFMTFDGDNPAGSGSVFMKDRIGWLDFGATLPEYRGRGSQGLLLSKRIEDCIELNCKTMFTATGVAVEGDPQHSYKNILRAGFDPFYLRENYEGRN